MSKGKRVIQKSSGRHGVVVKTIEQCEYDDHAEGKEPKMTDTFDITPQGMQTPEGVQRVNAHVKLCEEATTALANVATDFFREHHVTLLELARGTAVGSDDRASLRDSLAVLEAVIEVRRKEQEGLLRAVAGHPPLQQTH